MNLGTLLNISDKIDSIDTSESYCDKCYLSETSLLLPYINLELIEKNVIENGERNQLMDWLMANQLSKDKKTIALVESWENSPSALQRRIFWYYQARLRWMGNTSHLNTEDLLTSIEASMTGEQPEVQWAMNFAAAWIGIYDEEYRTRSITLGEKIGLYKDEVVARGCTPNYLPKFIEIEVNKRNN